MQGILEKIILRKSMTLKQKIRYGFFINVIFIFFIVLLIIFLFYDYQKQQIYELQIKRVKESTSFINKYIDETFSDVRLLSSLDDFIHFDSNYKNKIISGIISNNAAFENFWVYSSDDLIFYGAKVKSDYRDFIPQDIKSDIDYYVSNDTIYISEVLYDLKRNPYVFYAVPLRSNEKITGFVAAKINFKFLSFYINQIQIGENGYVYVVDRKNRILASKMINREMQLTRSEVKTLTFFLVNREEKYKTYKGLYGDLSIGAADIITSARWTLLAEIPVSEAYRPLYSIIAISLLSLIFIIAVSLFLVFTISERITSPLATMLKASDQISNGNFDINLPVSVQDEFGVLKNSFNKMAGKLSEIVSDLEENRKKYKYIFDNVGVALFEEDYSEIYEKFRKLKKDGVEKLETLIESNPDIIREMAESIKIVDVNNQAVKMYSADSKEHLLTSLHNIFSDNSLDAFKEQLIALYDGKTFYSCESVNRNVNNQEIDILLSIFFPKDSEESKKVLVSIMDISRQKQTEKYLSEEREKFAVTLSSIADGVIATDIYGNIVLINNEAENIISYNKKECTGKKIYKLLDIYSETNGIKENLWERLKKNYTKSNDLLLKDKNGVIKNISEASSIIKDEDNNTIGYVFVFRDITDQLKIEKETNNLQKLESIGILAGGIAHDFNNLLTAIMGNITLSKMQLEKDNEIYQMLEDAEKASKRAQTLTMQLLTFSKGGKPVKESIDVDALIKESLSFVLTGSNVISEYETLDEISNIFADAGQISQVFNNLFINAKQSMPDGGVIHVSCSNYFSNGIEGAHKKGSYVKVIIKDMGCGIPENLLNKIFDPFFTTKETGSGLGLATTFSIIQQHDGYIHGGNNPDKGAFFEILLPSSDEKQSFIENESEVHDFSGGKILILDDESIVLDVSRKILNQLGFNVTAVKTGEEAHKEYLRSFNDDDAYKLVILDLTVPGGYGGAELLKDLQKINPEIKAIVSSGYSNNPVMSNYKNYGFKGIIQKPFTIEKISAVLKKIIE